MIIQAKKIEAILGGTNILNGIDIVAKEHEFTGIIGPNGSGKSTLLKCIYRTLKPSSGAVFLDGLPLNNYTIKESAKKVSVVSQHNSVSFDFSVLEMVLMGRSPHKRALERDNEDDYKIVRHSLKKVGLENFENRIFTTLSGGEKQRVILAQALSQETPSLILDEPTNHLDIGYQLQIMEIIKGLEITVIAAIHDLNIAAMYCDRIFVVMDGSIVAQGTPEEVLTQNNILNFYGVETEIIHDNNGRIHILYLASKSQ